MTRRARARHDSRNIYESGGFVSRPEPRECAGQSGARCRVAGLDFRARARESLRNRREGFRRLPRFPDLHTTAGPWRARGCSPLGDVAEGHPRVMTEPMTNLDLMTRKRGMRSTHAMDLGVPPIGTSGIRVLFSAGLLGSGFESGGLALFSTRERSRSEAPPRTRHGDWANRPRRGTAPAQRT